MKLALDIALALLDNCQAIIVTGHDTMPVVYPSVSHCDDDGEIENGWRFLELDWSCDRYNYSLAFDSNENSEVEFSAGSLYLTDVKGEKYALSLLSTITHEEAARIIDIAQNFNPEVSA